MRKFFVFLFSLVFISGCSSKFAYNNLDWLVYWYIDDYIELTDAQEAKFDGKLATWLSWHKQQELGQYVEHLSTVKEQALMAEGLSPEEIASQFASARQHWDRLRQKLSPELAQMATELTDDQVVYLFAALEKDNQKEEDEREEEALDEAERIDDRTDRIVDQIEDMIGKTTADQRQIIATYSPQYQSTFDHWLTYRRAVQAEARTLFATRDTNPEFVSELTALMLDPDAYRSEQYVAITEQNRLLMATMLSEIHSTLTDKQKRKLSKEISAIIDDLEDLMS